MEILVATTVFSVLLVIVISVIGQTSTIWRRSSETIEAFQGARLGSDLIIRTLGQATLNTYLDYDDPSQPTRYLRQSDLHFKSGPAGVGGLPGTPGTGTALFFQAPLGFTRDSNNFGGLSAGLNVCGFYVQFGPPSDLPGHVSQTGPYRYRLMQMLVPVEDTAIFGDGSDGWFQNFTSFSFPVADNVVALIAYPEDPGDPALFSNVGDYDSRLNADQSPQPVSAHQLPPVMKVTLVTIDETSAARLENGAVQPGIIQNALAGKFTNPARLDEDLDAFVNTLASADIGVNYRIFSTAVPIPEAKWTK